MARRCLEGVEFQERMAARLLGDELARKNAPEAYENSWVSRVLV